MERKNEEQKGPCGKVGDLLREGGRDVRRIANAPMTEDRNAIGAMGIPIKEDLHQFVEENATISASPKLPADRCHRRMGEIISGQKFAIISLAAELFLGIEGVVRTITV